MNAKRTRITTTVTTSYELDDDTIQLALIQYLSTQGATVTDTDDIRWDWDSGNGWVTAVTMTITRQETKDEPVED